MNNRSDCNVHGLEFREAKPSQGDPSRPVSELFRLDKRSVISKNTISPQYVNNHADLVSTQSLVQQGSWAQRWQLPFSKAGVMWFAWTSPPPQPLQTGVSVLLFALWSNCMSK